MKTLISLAIFVLSLTTINSNAQTYHKVRVTKNDGFTVEGKQAVLSSQSISLVEGDMQRTYALDDVLYIQAKEGKARKWALGCGGGCAGVMLVSVIAAQASDNVDVYGNAAGVVFWVGVSTGVGALIGTLTDSYETVYSNTGNRTSFIDNIELKGASTYAAPYGIGLAYKF